MATKCARCGNTERPLNFTNNYCKPCMREYNHERYLLRKANQLIPTGSREGWNSRTVIMDPSHEYIFTDSHWEEYEEAIHGALVGVVIKEKDFDEAI